MANIQDVLNTVVAQVSGILYPNGTGQASICGPTVNVFPGWPIPEQVDADMRVGVADVSVYATTTERNTTRYSPKQHVMSVNSPTVTLIASGNTLTIGGSIPATYQQQNVAAIVQGQAFIYPVQSTDSLQSIATGLAVLIAGAFPGTANTGLAITLPPGVSPAAARVGTMATVAAEWKRQEQVVQITTWAPDPTTRGNISGAIEAALAQMSFITMPDGFGARIRYQNSRLSDEGQAVKIFRRDLFYTVEYATTVTQQVATVVAVKTTVQDQSGNPISTRSY